MHWSSKPVRTLAVTAGLALLVSAVGPCPDATVTLSEGELQRDVRGDRPAATAEPRESATPEDERGAAQVPPSIRKRQQTPTTESYMHGEFDHALSMQRAVIQGDLMGFRAAAGRIASAPWTPNLREDYARQLEPALAAARSAANVESLPAAAAALATLGETCASCHQALGGPKASALGEPAFDVSADPSMVAHARAAERLWEALVIPSEASWFEGAKRLVDAPALGSDVPEIAATAARLRDLAREGTTAKPADRARIYAEVLVTCSQCHDRSGVRVPPLR